MFIKLLCLVVIISACVGDVSEDEYVDAVLDMLLNGVSREFEQSDEDDSGDEPVLTGGVWKCGNCDNIDESRLIYSEVNTIDADMITDDSMDTQIGISHPDMKCVTVNSDVAGVVRRVAGACSGDTVTLSVAPAQHFTITQAAIDAILDCLDNTALHTVKVWPAEHHCVLMEAVGVGNLTHPSSEKLS